MKTRSAAALFILALPALAQQEPARPAEPAASETLFYKAFWLERGERNFAEAMTLYQQFLDQAPDHRLARQAASFQFELLTRTGKTKDAEAFAQKYKNLLGDVAVGAPATGEGQGGDRPERGGRGGRGDAARGNPQERLAELKKQLEEAKASGNEEEAARLQRQIARIEQMAQGGGQRGQRGGFGQPVAFASMTKEQLDEFKTQRLERMSGMVDRLREAGQEERAKQMEDSIKELKKALEEHKLDEAQKIWDKMAAGRRGRRGG